MTFSKPTLLLTFLFILFGSFLQAQEVHALKFKKKIAPLQNLDFSIDKILDRRLDKSNSVGSVRIGMTNAMRTAVLGSNAFADELYTLVNRIAPTKDQNTKYYLAVHELKIGERLSNGSEFASIDMDLELVLEKNNVLYSVGNYAYQNASSGMDVTRGHGKRIVHGLRMAMLNFKNQINNLPTSLPLYDTAYYHFDFTNLPPNGAYDNFRNLAKHNPIEQFEVQLKRKNGKDEVYNLVSSNSMKTKIAFIVFNKEIFIPSMQNGQTVFMRSLLTGRYCYYESKTFDQTAYMAFGLIGAALSNKKMSLILDTKNGKVLELTDKKIIELSKESDPSFFESYRNSRRKPEDKAIFVDQVNLWYRMQANAEFAPEEK